MRLSKLATYLRRYWRARKLGVGLPLNRIGTAHDYAALLPRALLLRGRRIALALPDEKGVRDAFLEVVLEDGYGLRRARGPLRSVLDIGANVGLFGLAVYDFYPNALVHAYEPNPALEPYLAAQTKATGGQYFMEAVTRDPGWIALEEIKGESVATRAVPSQSGSIRAVSFRQALARLGGGADFAKLDCEGAEWEILTDAAPWQGVSNLSLEYHYDQDPGHTGAEARRRVEALGFRVDAQEESSFRTGWICARRPR